MNQAILTTAVMLGLASGAAQANLTINGTHQETVPNSLEQYYIQANTTGSYDIFMASQAESQFNTNMNGLLSVWQEVGNNWVLVGANDDAARVFPDGSTTVYGTPVLGFSAAAGQYSGVADAGLTLNLTAGNTYMIVQSENQNGPNSLLKDPFLNTTTGAIGWDGTSPNQTFGQTFAIGSDIASQLWGQADPFGAGSDINQYNVNYSYLLSIIGNASIVSAPIPSVPLPAAFWLFGTALAGLGLMKRGGQERTTVMAA